MLIHGSVCNALNFQCNADLCRFCAAGQVAVVVAFAHAHPEAVCIKGSAGHQHQIQLFRFQQHRPFQYRRADAVQPCLPAVRAGHGGGEGAVFSAHRVGQHLAPAGRFGGKPGKACFTPKGRIQQDGLGILHGVQLPQPGTQRRVGGGPLLRRKGPAGRFAGCALGLLFLGDVHTEHLVSSVIVES